MRPRPDGQRVDVQYAANGRDGLWQNTAGVVEVRCGEDRIHMCHEHRRSPGTNETKLLFARMDFHGIGNDINMAVRALSTAIIQERQIIFLPPSKEDRDANEPVSHF